MRGMIVSFSHTNYMVRSAGTEKFIKNVSSMLQNEEYLFVHFFSFYHDLLKIKNKGKNKTLGLNVNDKFIGVYSDNELLSIVRGLCSKYNTHVSAIHLEHLLNYNLDKIEQVIVALQAPVYYFVHDYYCVCSRLKLVDSNNVFCGISAPSDRKCNKCKYYTNGNQHFIEMKNFINNINDCIEKVIVPSQYVAHNLPSVYPEFSKKIVVREHLVCKGTRNYAPVKDKIRIAYAGGQLKEKGYESWIRLVEFLSKNFPDSYELYYFGNGKHQQTGVKSVYVSTAEQGDDAMVKALNVNSIDCAFVWPMWAETYSYVYYELAVNGIYILTNSVSGNIADQVTNNKNGIVFNDYVACKDMLGNVEVMRRKIDEYREKGIFRPEQFENNSDLETLVPREDVSTMVIPSKFKIPMKDMLRTSLYGIKYKALLK